MAARALEFTILTAARSGEVRHAIWDEVDVAARIWTIPAERMKASREHRVPLNEAAMSVLRSLPRIEGGDVIFQSARTMVLREDAMLAVCRRLDADCVPHGFRSTFRDWCAECTNASREVAEAALAHTVTNAVEAAYRRGDLFEKRRVLMEQWSLFLSIGVEERTGR